MNLCFYYTFILREYSRSSSSSTLRINLLNQKCPTCNFNSSKSLPTNLELYHSNNRINMEYQKDDNNDTAIICQILYGHTIFEVSKRQLLIYRIVHNMCFGGFHQSEFVFFKYTVVCLLFMLNQFINIR